MLIVQTSLKEYEVHAKDGRIGKIEDCLFDQRNWKIRWLVLDTGTWLSGRQVLIHPSAFSRPDPRRSVLSVQLTKAQIEASPEISTDQPVSQQMELNVYGYYGWNSMWGVPGYFAGYPMAMDLPADDGRAGDPNLRSMHAIEDYHIEASDGAIGHLENFILDDTDWEVRYLVVDTKNWWIGKRVLLSPFAVRDVSWAERQVRVGVTREQVKGSPPWNPEELVDESYQKRLHSYYSWPAYGW
jgi:hypothetical protein